MLALKKKTVQCICCRLLLLKVAFALYSWKSSFSRLSAPVVVAWRRRAIGGGMAGVKQAL